MNYKQFLAIFGTLALILVVYLLTRYFVKGELVVNTEPSGATITIDDEKNYSSPLVIKLPQGKHTISAYKDGYVESLEIINIKGKDKVTINFKLIDEKFVEGTAAERLAAIYTKLPVTTDHFEITWNDPTLKISIQPVLPTSSSLSDEEAVKQYWNEYTTYGKEALQWLEENSLDQNVRNENGIEIEWWGKDYWPENATEPSL